MDGIDDSDAAGEFAEICAADKIGDEGVDGKRAQRERTEENDAEMGAGWVLSQIGEFDIQSQEHALELLRANHPSLAAPGIPIQSLAGIFKALCLDGSRKPPAGLYIAIGRASNKFLSNAAIPGGRPFPECGRDEGQ
jgi:hypothetical protein